MNTITKDTFKTSEVLQIMLMEDTGIDLLDSGGQFNRNWQKNSDGQFAHRSAGYVEYEEVKLSLYHYLLDRLEYSRFQTEQFRLAYPNGAGMNEMVAYVNDNGLGSPEQGTGVAYNTYNHEHHLDQEIQFVEYQITDIIGDIQHYVILQTHNGADVRGGYSLPWIFKADPEWISDCYDIGLWCGDCGIPVVSNGGQVEQPVQSLHVKSKITSKGVVIHYYEEYDVNNGILWEALCPSCNEVMEVSPPSPYWQN